MSTATESSVANTISLNQLRIASPCTADWDAMSGDDRTRHCGDCNLNVYNISAMTETEARELIASAEGRVCVRIYRRADGTVLTQDCPIGLAKLRRKARAAWMKVAAVFTLVTGGLALGRVARQSDESQYTGSNSISDLPGIRHVKQFLTPSAPQPAVIMGEVMMGDIAFPPDELAPPIDPGVEMGGASLPLHLNTGDSVTGSGDCGVTPAPATGS